MRDNRSNHQPRDTEFEEKMIQVSRVSKKTKGGNNVGFSVLMVVGDRKGRVGVGLGKASDVATAMKKGAKKAKKRMILVPLRGTTIPFKVVIKEGAGVVMLKPAPKGSGIIAGGPVRAVVDAAGIRDISSKILGSSNKASSVYATFEALKQIQQLVALRNLPGKPIVARDVVANATITSPVAGDIFGAVEPKKELVKPSKKTVSTESGVKPEIVHALAEHTLVITTAKPAQSKPKSKSKTTVKSSKRSGAKV